MSENWQAGDLAECINVCDIRGRDPYRPLNVRTGGRLLIKGMIYPVLGVELNEEGELLLDVGAQLGPKLACRFRKVPPLAQEAPERLAVPRELEAA